MTIIKTHKDDKYGRYLVDVFYVPPSNKMADAPRSPKGEAGVTSETWDPVKVAAEGKYLNQELLNERLAVIWKG